MNQRRGSSPFGKTYRVVDIWHALRTTLACWFSMWLALTLCGGLLIWLLLSGLLPALWFWGWLLICVLPASLFAWHVWHAQSAGILIDPQRATLAFSADDLENNLHDIISLRRFFDHAKRLEIAIADIERLDNDNIRTGKGRGRRRQFALNLSGDFGSYQLMFSHKQKRDECRTLITQVMQRIRGKAPVRDTNIAFPY